MRNPASTPRAFVHRHPVLMYSPLVLANLRKIVETSSWEEMEEGVAIAVTNNADEPSAYAKKTIGQRRDKAKLKNQASTPERLKGAVVHAI